MKETLKSIKTENVANKAWKKTQCGLEGAKTSQNITLVQITMRLLICKLIKNIEENTWIKKLRLFARKKNYLT